MSISASGFPRLPGKLKKIRNRGGVPEARKWYLLTSCLSSERKRIQLFSLCLLPPPVIGRTPPAVKKLKTESEGKGGGELIFAVRRESEEKIWKKINKTGE